MILSNLHKKTITMAISHVSLGNEDSSVSCLLYNVNPHGDYFVNSNFILSEIPFGDRRQ